MRRKPVVNSHRAATPPPVRRRGRRLIVALAAATIVACDSGDVDLAPAPDRPGSGDYSTRQLHLWATVEAVDDSMAKVTASLYPIPRPHGTFFASLTKDDRLTACVGAVCASLTPPHPSSYDYTAELPYVAEGIYTIALSRSTDVSALNSFVTMPAFALLSPPAGIPVTDGQTLTVQWSPPNTSWAYVDSAAHCYHDRGVESDREASLESIGIGLDTGTAVVSVDEMLAARVTTYPVPQTEVRRCDIALEVSHSRRGTFDSALGTNSYFFVGVLRRAVTLHYTPSP